MKKLFYCFGFVIGLFAGLSMNGALAQNTFLSDTMDAVHYDVYLDVNHQLQNQLSGHTVVHLTPKVSSVNKVKLQLLNFTVDSIFQESTKIPSWNYNNDILEVPLSVLQNQTDTFAITAYYHGSPTIEPYGWGGFHISNAVSYNLGVAFDANPHNYGRAWFPCIDDFIDKASYDFYITAAPGNNAVCNGSLLQTTTNNDNSKTFHWRLNEIIPGYLVSVAVSNYAAVEGIYHGMNGPIPTYIYANPSDTANARASFIHLNNMMQIFENKWGSYRWNRVGYVSTPLGAMEHPTNICYPTGCIDGTLNYETLAAHELSHHWFGDLITCASAEDMWINEGWATYSEALFMEGMYGNEAAKAYRRDKMRKVLQFAHYKDAGYRALYGIPNQYTYGETVYQKGALVAQSLRSYLGDTVFFNAIKQIMNDYAFRSVSSSQMRDYLSAKTGVNLNDFYQFHVFQPGFTHFAVDSFKVLSTSGACQTQVWVRQRLNNAPSMAQNNRLEISFMGQNWQIYKDTIHFDDQTGNKVFTIPFSPVLAMIDMEERFSDATTDCYRTLKNTGIVEFPETFFSADVLAVSDSAFMRVTHNWVKPDDLKQASMIIYRLSPNRFWTVEGVLPAGFQSKGKFTYTKQNNQTNGLLDNKLLPAFSSADSLVLLYRQNCADDWKITPFTKQGDPFSGYLIANELKQGEYTLGIGNPNQSGVEKTEEKVMKISPNPAKEGFYFEMNNNEDCILIISDLKGKIIERMEIRKTVASFYWRAETLSKGIYQAIIINKQNIPIDSQKLIKE